MTIRIFAESRSTRFSKFFRSAWYFFQPMYAASPTTNKFTFRGWGGRVRVGDKDRARVG